jgi:DNA modification methylase
MLTTRTEILADGVTLHMGDCAEILPTLPRADAVVTSPPYNTLPASAKASGLHNERRGGGNQWLERAAAGYADQRPEDEYQAWLNDILRKCASNTKGLIWVNHKVRYREGEAIPSIRFG